MMIQPWVNINDLDALKREIIWTCGQINPLDLFRLQDHLLNGELETPFRIDGIEWLFSVELDNNISYITEISELN